MCLVAVAPIAFPRAVQTPQLVFRMVTAGARHSCGIVDPGVAYCWGDNSSGALGTGTRRSHVAPVAVADSHAFVMLSAGDGFTCGIVQQGDAYCWGANKFGQLGNGGRDATPTPWPVTGNLVFTSISAGADHTCAVTIDHVGYCWGANDEGQLGIGDSVGAVTRPRVLAGRMAFAAIRAGWSHACGVALDGHAYCWGANDRGQLGNATTTPSRVPVEVTHIHDFVSVGVGETHSCGLTTGGMIYCWGDNLWAQLGPQRSGFRGSAMGSWVPNAIAGDRLTGVAVGAYHTCRLKVPSAFRVACWGSNQSGQLGLRGNLPPGSRVVSERVFEGYDFIQLDAGEAHTCGITEDGAAYCWGRNEDGELGNGRALVTAKPVRVAEPDTLSP